MVIPAQSGCLIDDGWKQQPRSREPAKWLEAGQGGVRVGYAENISTNQIRIRTWTK